MLKILADAMSDEDFFLVPRRPSFSLCSHMVGGGEGVL